MKQANKTETPEQGRKTQAGHKGLIIVFSLLLACLMVTGFLFTLSNPLIMFLIIPLFARFSFPLPEYKLYHIIIGYAFIVAGALLWWAVITFFVDKVRSHFNIRSMWLINRIIGSIILLLSLYGLVTGTYAYLQELQLI